MHQRRGEVEAALHASRVGPDAPLGGLGQADPLEQRVGAAPALGAVEPVERGLHPDQLHAGHQRVEGRLLEGDADRAPDRGRLGDDVVTGHPRGPAGRPQQRGQHPDRGRLAGAVGTEEGVDLTLGDLQVDARDREHLFGEGPLQVVDLDGGHGVAVYVRWVRIPGPRCLDLPNRRSPPRNLRRGRCWDYPNRRTEPQINAATHVASPAAPCC